MVTHKSKHGYDVSCPGLPGCHSQGDTKMEALKNIKDAIYVSLGMVRKTQGDKRVRITLRRPRPRPKQRRIQGTKPLSRRRQAAVEIIRSTIPKSLRPLQPMDLAKELVWRSSPNKRRAVVLYCTGELHMGGPYSYESWLLDEEGSVFLGPTCVGDWCYKSVRWSSDSSRCAIRTWGREVDIFDFRLRSWADLDIKPSAGHSIRFSSRNLVRSGKGSARIERIKWQPVRALARRRGRVA